MNDGIKQERRQAIIDLLAANERVDRVVLFGSRAMGSHRPASDVDLALFGDALTLTDQAKLADAIDQLTMPQQVDLKLFKTIDNPKLIDQIQNHGVVWFERRGKAHKLEAPVGTA